MFRTHKHTQARIESDVISPPQLVARGDNKLQLVPKSYNDLYHMKSCCIKKSDGIRDAIAELQVTFLNEALGRICRSHEIKQLLFKMSSCFQILAEFFNHCDLDLGRMWPKINRVLSRVICNNIPKYQMNQVKTFRVIVRKPHVFRFWRSFSITVTLTLDGCGRKSIVFSLVWYATIFQSIKWIRLKLFELLSGNLIVDARPHQTNSRVQLVATRLKKTQCELWKQ